MHEFAEGKSFATRLGEKYTVVEIREGGNFPLVARDAKGLTFRFKGDGKWRGDGQESSHDLVAEWQDETRAAHVTMSDEAYTYVRKTELPAGSALLDWSATATADYAPLAAVLQEAYDQAASGKGKERHANDRAFVDQPILEIGRMCGPGFNTGQSIKKQQEAMGMLTRGQTDAAIRELLGSINYAASAIMLIREQNTGS